MNATTCETLFGSSKGTSLWTRITNGTWICLKSRPIPRRTRWPKKGTKTPNRTKDAGPKDVVASGGAAAKTPTPSGNRRIRMPINHADPTRADLTTVALHNRVPEATAGGRKGPNSRGPNHKDPKRFLVGALPIVCSRSERAGRFSRFGLGLATPR